MKTAVADTSIAYYRSPDGKKVLGAQELVVLAAVRYAGRPLTLSEIRREVLRQSGADLPESTISGRLHDLAEKSLVTDDNPKRECSVTNRTKKTWSYLAPNANPQRSLFSRN